MRGGFPPSRPDGRPQHVLYDGTVLAFAVFVPAGLAIGYWLGGPESEDRRVLSLATASRHPGMALVIPHANFLNQKLDMPAMALYEIVNAALLALLSIKRKRRVAVQPQAEIAKLLELARSFLLTFRDLQCVGATMGFWKSIQDNDRKDILSVASIHSHRCRK